MRQIMGAIAEYDRAMITARLTAAKERARANDPDYKEGRKNSGHREGESETLNRMV